MIRAITQLLLLVAALAACERTPDDVPALPTAPGLTFVNGPAELPHVLRSGGRIISAFIDVDRDLLVVAGAPDDPATDVACGGQMPREFVPVQWVGEFTDVVKQLALLDEMNILVYQPIPPSGAAALCATAPIASGTGKYLRTDNDFFGVFGRANAVFELVHGSVQLAAGGAANLSARFEAKGLPDGTLHRFETTIHLQPIGRPQ